MNGNANWKWQRRPLITTPSQPFGIYQLELIRSSMYHQRSTALSQLRTYHIVSRVINSDYLICDVYAKCKMHSFTRAVPSYENKGVRSLKQVRVAQGKTWNNPNKWCIYIWWNLEHGELHFFCLPLACRLAAFDWNAIWCVCVYCARCEQVNDYVFVCVNVRAPCAATVRFKSKSWS